MRTLQEGESRPRDLYTVLHDVYPRDRQVVWETCQKYDRDKDLDAMIQGQIVQCSPEALARLLDAQKKG